jgi:branched-chain amino acid aminotransferase
MSKHVVTPWAWFNGRLVATADVAPSIASPSLHLGIGVFDGLMAYWRDGHYRCPMLREHLHRFCESCTTVGLAHPWAEDALVDAIRLLLARVSPGDHYIRPFAYRHGPRVFLTSTAERAADVVVFGMRADTGRTRELACTFSSVPRVSGLAIPVHCKMSGAYANSYLARRAAEASGHDDGLMLDAAGHVTEASAANVFFVAGDRICTPRITPDVFPGLTRQLVFEFAAALRVGVEERSITPADVRSFDAAFLTATLMEIQPVTRISDIRLKSVANRICQAVTAAYRKYVDIGGATAIPR